MKSAKCENCRRRAEEEKHSQMNIYHVSQDENGQYDTFSDFVVVAKDAKIARSTHPCGHEIDWRRVRKAERKYRIYMMHLKSPEGLDIEYCDECRYFDNKTSGWASKAASVKVKFIGRAYGYKTTTVICSSFHAG